MDWLVTIGGCAAAGVLGSNVLMGYFPWPTPGIEFTGWERLAQSFLLVGVLGATALYLW